MNREPTKKLRFAVMVPGEYLKAWQIRVLESLSDSGQAQPALIIRDARQDTPPGLRDKLRKYAGRYGLYHLYTKFFQRVPAMRNETWGDVIHGIPELKIVPERKGRFSEYIGEGDREAIERYNPDFILRFGFNILRGQVLNSARYGVWSFHHADEQVFRGGPPAFWEVFHRHDKIGVVLQRLTEDIDGGVILRKGWFPVTKHSWNETLDRVLQETGNWPRRVCEDIVAGRMDPLSIAASGISAPMNTLPHNGRMLQFVFRLLVARLSFYVRRYLQVEEWNIGLVQNDPLASGEIVDEPHWLLPTNRHWFAADPCIASIHSGNTWIIYEKFRHGKVKGILCALQLDHDTATEVTLLEKDYHLAFPRVFSSGDTMFMTAETAGSGSTWIFELGEKDGSLAILAERELEDIPAIDPVLHKHDGTWYLFYTLKETGTNTSLHISYAPSLDGPWAVHPMNPVKTDISSARPAGPFFVLEGILYRPSQDSAGEYGSRIAINRVDVLSPSDYRETMVKWLMPGPGWKYNKGLHTLDKHGEFWVVDAKRIRNRMNII